MKQVIFQIGKQEILQMPKSDIDLINTNTNTDTNTRYVELINVITSNKPLKVAENVYYFNK